MKPSKLVAAGVFVAFFAACPSLAEHDASLFESPLYYPISNLTESTADGRTWFILFYAPWCPKSQEFAPTWEKLAENFEQDLDVAFATVDCDTEVEACEYADVYQYPTLQVYHDGAYVGHVKRTECQDLIPCAHWNWAEKGYCTESYTYKTPDGTAMSVEDYWCQETCKECTGPESEDGLFSLEEMQKQLQDMQQQHSRPAQVKDHWS